MLPHIQTWKGHYFVTQNPTDIPDAILGQLGNRVQHALRAFTPKDQKAVRSAAETFRANPAFKTEEAIMELATGEALVSFLDEKGSPAMVQRAKILFPLSQIGAISEQQRDQIIKQSRLYGRYDNVIDRESAFEVLLAESEKAAKEKEEQAAEEARVREEKKSSGKSSVGKGIFGAILGAAVTSLSRSLGNEIAKSVTGSSKRSSKSSGKSTVKTAAGKALGNAASTATRQITRSLLGNLLK